ncbi:hypothetical protein [Fluviicola chungangensis]|uniref:Uncharacterized protein n=1 Tax=Fluviicola chungangensis TaxID=2597671 RepID=A0A556MRE7_9FLAO|nr:hypothetical protein [Fluviicola chungangensis]TSJ42500.1 hypothetical protein FO442_12090 [Fluviicola chungangensis]
MLRKNFFLFSICLLTGVYGFSQERKDTLPHLPIESGQFVKNQNQRFGFFERVKENNKNGYEAEVFKSVGKAQTDVVDFKINRLKFPSVDSIEFYIRTERIASTRVNEIKQRIFLPASNKDYDLVAKFQGGVISTLHVSVLPVVIQKVRIVPLMKAKINADSLEKELNVLFAPANVRFEVTVDPVFESDAFEMGESFENPGPDRLKYTNQMRHVRDVYQNSYKDKTINTLLFFVIPRFVNPALKGYIVKNKSLGFLMKNNSRELAHTMAMEYLEGFANIESEQENPEVWGLDNEMWIRVNKNPSIYSIIDDYEEVVTNNGLIAYYFFEQNKDGSIVLKNKSFLASVIRPMKKNTYSYHLQIDNILYKTLFRIKSKPFNILHLLSVLLSVGGFVYGFRKLRGWLKMRMKKPRLVSFFSRFIQWTGILVLSFVLMKAVDLGYSWFEVTDGVIKSYSGLNEKKVLDLLFDNRHPHKLEEKRVGSELIVKRNKQYFLYERKKVLYFKMNVSKQQVPVKLRLIANSDSLKTDLLEEAIDAKSHYIVVKIYSAKGKWLRDQVYNHLGVDLTSKLKLEDPPKRILVFVNGYRPTSLGSTFEENFEDIRSNGLEFPNSLNRLFTEDRYNYWHPWKQIDDTFRLRINPTEYYYADGHHSVSTSNHRSLLNFSTNSGIYPKRCRNPKMHTCYTTSTVGSKLFGSRKAKTLSLLATKPNKRGFAVRVNGGRIAGRNLFQMLNELPNSSKNDTLYLVVHSMGFAYAQGMIEQLRGKINFGAYYILAPENASTGTVNRKEWKHVWQYGSNLHTVNQDAPCLQDGVAPQASVKGLSEKQRIYIPKNLYNHKGYFDSHFVGWYDWVLAIPSGKKGHVEQH